MKARFAALATLLLASCGDYSAPSSVVNGLVVATQFAPTATWGSYLTYSIDPTAAVVDNTGTVSLSCSVDGSRLVPTIKANMDARGYQQVPWKGAGIPSGADLEMKMTAMLGSQSVYYPGYCGWYPLYWCYPEWTYVGDYSYGTLVLTMGDASHASAGELPLVWTAANYGVLSTYYPAGCSGGASGNNVDFGRLQGGIDQAFEDAPYIKRTP